MVEGYGGQDSRLKDYLLRLTANDLPCYSESELQDFAGICMVYSGIEDYDLSEISKIEDELTFLAKEFSRDQIRAMLLPAVQFLCYRLEKELGQELQLQPDGRGYSYTEDFNRKINQYVEYGVITPE